MGRMTEGTRLSIQDNPGCGRLEVEIDGAVSYAQYTLIDATITFTHTLVPEALRGRGIGTQLVQAGLAAAQAQHRLVIPQCSLFADYMRRHPETHALLAPAARAQLQR
jgi:predicted GNAT family acetyltransferase